MVFSLNYLKQYRLDLDASMLLSMDLGGGIQDDLDMNFRQDGDLTALTPALAVDVSDRLSLGLALNVWNDDITGASKYRDSIRYTETLSFFGFPFPATDNYINVESTVDDGYSVVLGGLYRLSKQWAVGAVVKPGYTLHLEERFYEDQDGTISTGRGGTTLDMPWTIGSGVAWRPSDVLTFSADVTWTQWSKYVLTSAAGEQLNPITEDAIGDRRCDDTVCWCR